MAIKLSELTGSSHSQATESALSKKKTIKPWQNIPREPDLLEKILQKDLPGKYKIKRLDSSVMSEPLSKTLSRGLKEQLQAKIKEAARHITDELNPE